MTRSCEPGSERSGGIGPLPPRQVMNNRDGTPMLSPIRYALATDNLDIAMLGTCPLPKMNYENCICYFRAFEP